MLFSMTDTHQIPEDGLGQEEQIHSQRQTASTSTPIEDITHGETYTGLLCIMCMSPRVLSIHFLFITASPVMTRGVPGTIG